MRSLPTPPILAPLRAHVHSGPGPTSALSVSVRLMALNTEGGDFSMCLSTEVSAEPPDPEVLTISTPMGGRVPGTNWSWGCQQRPHPSL